MKAEQKQAIDTMNQILTNINQRIDILQEYYDELYVQFRQSSEKIGQLQCEILNLQKHKDVKYKPLSISEAKELMQNNN